MQYFTLIQLTLLEFINRVDILLFEIALSSEIPDYIAQHTISELSEGNFT